MKINNKRVNVFIETIYALLFLGLLSSIFLIVIPISIIVKIVSPYVLVALFILMIFGLYKMGHQNFEYNSDGEVFNIRTQDAFWAKYFPQTKVFVDFPKSKLVNYKIKNTLFQKKLELIVSSKRSSNGVSKLSFNISYLNNNEIADLKKSLNKNIQKNKN